MAKSKIRESAKGESCSLRLHPKCTDEFGAVVLCHIGKSRGMGIKCGDHFAVYGCNHCHDVIDNRVYTEFSAIELEREKLRALEETQLKLINKGLLNVV